MKNAKLKKILKIVGNVVFAVFMVLILTFAITNIVAAKSTSRIPSLFNRGYLTVESNSMDGDNEDSFAIGDLITVKIVKDGDKNLQIGDIVTYYDVSEQKIITHRIIKVEAVEATGNVFYTVKGDNTPDVLSAQTVLRHDEILAVYTGQVKGLGTTIAWFQKPLGFFIIVVLPTILFLIYELVRFIQTYMETKGTGKKELTEEEINAEREKIKAELLAQLQAEGKLPGAAENKTEQEIVEEDKVEEVKDSTTDSK